MRKNEYLSDKYTKLKTSSPEDAISESSSGDSLGSDVMRCALGLIMHKLGINFYEAEEGKEGLEYLKKSFELMNSLPDMFKLRHLNTIQDLYNHIAIILSDRGGANEKQDVEKNLEALQYLEKAIEIYKLVVEKAKDLPMKTIMNNFDLYLLKSSSKKPEAKDAKFSFYINSGLDLKKLEQKYTTTLFIIA